MSVKLLTEHHLEFLSLKGGCTGSSESTLVKMQHCWKLHATAHLLCVLDSSQISDWRFQSLEQLQESSSDEDDEFYDAEGM